MLLKLGHKEHIVNVLEPTPEVQSIGCLPYVLDHPEKSHQPSSELPSACQIKGLLLRRVAFLPPTDPPIAYSAYQSNASGSLMLSSDDSWRPGLGARCAERS